MFISVCVTGDFFLRRPPTLHELRSYRLGHWTWNHAWIWRPRAPVRHGRWAIFCKRVIRTVKDELCPLRMAKLREKLKEVAIWTINSCLCGNPEKTQQRNWAIIEHFLGRWRDEAMVAPSEVRQRWHVPSCVSASSQMRWWRRRHCRHHCRSHHCGGRQSQMATAENFRPASQVCLRDGRSKIKLKLLYKTIRTHLS